MKRLEDIDHIALEVENIKKAVDWYKNNFNCNILYVDDTWAMLQFNNIKLAFVLPDLHPRHIAFKKDNAEKFGPLNIHRDGIRFIYIDDAQGNTIEILEK